MKHVKLEAMKAISRRKKKKKTHLHRLADARISNENDTSVASDGFKQLFIEWKNKQHIWTKCVTQKDWSIGGTICFHPRATEAFCFHRTQRLADLGQFFGLGKLETLELLRLNDGKSAGRLT